MANEFFLYKQQANLEQEYGRLEKSKLPAKAKQQLKDFARIRLAKGASKLRVVKCLWCLRLMAEWLGKDYATATQDDLIGLVSLIDAKDYSDYTKYDFKIVLKMFYKWLKGKDEEYPKVV